MNKLLDGPWAVMPGAPHCVTDMPDHSDPLYFCEVNGNDDAEIRARAQAIAMLPEMMEALREIAENDKHAEACAFIARAILNKLEA